MKNIKYLKKTIVSMLVSIMIIATSPMIVLGANDETAPVIEPQTKAGTVLAGQDLNFKITDNTKVSYVFYTWNRRMDGKASSDYEIYELTAQEEKPEYVFDRIKAPSIPGLYEFSIAAQDYYGNMTNWVNIPYEVVSNQNELKQDNEKPTFNFKNGSYPSNGATIAQNQSITIDAIDDSGIYYIGYIWTKNLSETKVVDNVRYRDSRITIQAPKELGDWYLILYARDRANNLSDTYYTKVTVQDLEKPVITLQGANPQIIKIGNNYEELGAKVTDNYDTNLTPVIDTTRVNTGVVGIYKVLYNAEDANKNNAEQVTRMVHVVDYVQLQDKLNYITDNFNKNDYTSNDWNRLQEVVQESINMINANQSIQTSIDAQVGKVQSVINSVQPADIVKTELDEIEKELEKLNKEDYTEESWNAIKDLIVEAKKQTLQSEFDKIVKTIDLNTLVELPKISNLEITTSNTNKKYAKVGDTITITFNTNVELSTEKSIVKIHEKQVELQKIDETEYKFSYTLTSDDVEGNISYAIRPIGLQNNIGDKAKEVSEITFDKTAPTIRFLNVAFGTDEENVNINSTYEPNVENIEVNDNITEKDKITIKINKENLKLDTIGDYEILYTAVDEAGNESQAIKKTIHVIDYIKDFEIIGLKKEYVYDEQLNLKDLKIKKIMASGAETVEEPITIDMIQGYDSSKVGEKTITVSYAGKTKEIKINIIPTTYDMSEVCFENKKVTYDGNAHSIQISGRYPTGLEIRYEGNEKTDAGTYTVTAKFIGDENHNPIPDMTATLTIEKANYDMSGVNFADATATYDGITEYELLITGNLPDGVKVEYEGNKQVNAGIYTVTAKFTGDKNHNEIPSKTATLTVNKADYNMSGISFANKKVTYNGEKHSLEITGALPEGVTVSYEGNEQTEVGPYLVTAKFKGDTNHKPIPDMEAILEITPADYDMSGISFANKKVTYNGEKHSLEITGALPEGVTVSYEGNEQTEVGPYLVTAKFKGDTNHKPIPDMEATLEITPADYDKNKIKFENKTVKYDGNPHGIYIEGDLPEGITVRYEGHGNGKIDAGTYTIVAKFRGNNPSYNAISDMTATLTIEKADYNMSGVKFADRTLTYNGQYQEIAITGELPEGIVVRYEHNKRKTVGTHTATAKFTGDANHKEIPDMTATLTMQPAPVTVAIDNKTSVYGEDFAELTSSVTEGTLHKGDDLHIELTKEKGYTVGDYIITGTYSNDNYDVKIINGTYTIKPTKVTMAIDNKESEYGDSLVELTYRKTSGNLYDDDDLGITLTKAGGTQVGTYAITGTYSNDNYEVTFVDGTYTITERQVTVTIDNATSVYGEPIIPNENLKWQVTAGNIIEGDDLGITLTKAEGTEVGTYGITGTAKNSNYNVTFIPGTYKITRTNTIKDLLTWNIKDKTYNKQAQGVTVTAKEETTGLGKITIKYNGAETVPVNAGEYEITVDVAKGKNNNAVTGIELESYTINKAPITVTISNVESIYGEDFAELTSKVTEGTLYEGDDLGITLTKADGTEVGTYGITGAYTNANYNVTFVDGTYTITKRPVTVTIDNATSVYGEQIIQNEKLTWQVTAGNIVEGDSLGITLTKAEGTEVGTYEITGTATNANYNVTFVNGKYTITPKSIENEELTIKVEDVELSSNQVAELEYNGSEKPVTVKLGEFNLNENNMKVKYAKLNSATGKYEEIEYIPKDVGEYQIKVTIKLEGSYAGERIETVKYNIKPKTITENDVTMNIEETLSYTGAPIEATVTGPEENAITSVITYYKEKENGEYEDLGAQAPKDIGTYEVIAEVTGTGNYTGTILVGKTVTINPRELTVKIEDVTSVYGEEIITNIGLKIVSGNIVDGDKLDIELKAVSIVDEKDISITPTTNAGTYIITGTGTVSNPNYKVTFENGTYTITKKPVTVVADNIKTTYGELAELTFTVPEGVLEGNDTKSDLKVTLTKEEGENVGTYKITGSSSEDSNYDVTVTEGTYTIKPAIGTKNPEYSVPQLDSIIYNSNITLANIKLPTGWSWSNPTIKPTEGKHSYKAKYISTNPNYMDVYNIDISLEVLSREITSISVSNWPEKTNYKYGEELNLNGGKIKVTYNDNSTENIDMNTSMITELDGNKFNANILGERNLLVTYGGKTANEQYQITVEDYINGIKIIQKPTKIVYKQNEDLDISGMAIVTVTASGVESQTPIDLKDVNVTGYNSGKIGTQTLTVTYGEFNATLKVAVTENLTKPVIVLNGEANVTVEVNTTYEDAGAIIATYNPANTIEGITITKTGIVDITKVGTYKITYSATNADDVVRTVNVVDTTAPVIKLYEIEDSEMEVNDEGDMTIIKFTKGKTTFDYENAASVTDNYDKDIKVTYTGTVDSEKAGTYRVVYTAIDSSNNKTEKVVTVIVLNYPPILYYINSDMQKIEIKDGEVYNQYLTVLCDKGINITIQKDYGTEEKYTPMAVLKDGIYTIKVDGGDGTSTEKTFIIDTIAPKVTISDDYRTITFEDPADVYEATLTNGYGDVIDLKDKLETTNKYYVDTPGFYTLRVKDAHGNSITPIKFMIT